MTDDPTPIRTAREALEAAMGASRRVYDSLPNTGPGWEAAQNGAALVGHALSLFAVRIAEPPPDERHAELRERITAWIREADGPPELDDDVVVRHAVRAYSLLRDCLDALGGTTDGK